MSKLTPKERARLASQAAATATAHKPGSTPVVPARSPITGPGQFAAFMAKESDALKENVELKAELAKWEGALPVQELDPGLIDDSKWANRHQDSFTGTDFAELKEEIKSAGGNVQPIKVRPKKGKSGRYEVVFGHRRLRACRELGLKVRAIIEEADDKKLFIEMDRENRGRKDLKPYEQGLMYRRALKEGLFKSPAELAQDLSVSPGNVSVALRIADLPDAIVRCFASPLEITYRMGTDLAELAKAPAEVIQSRCGAINPGMDAKLVFQLLTMPQAKFDAWLARQDEEIDVGAVAKAAHADATAKDKIPAKMDVVNGAGNKLATIKRAAGGAVSVAFDKAVLLSDEKLLKLQGFLAKLTAD